MVKRVAAAAGATPAAPKAAPAGKADALEALTFTATGPEAAQAQQDQQAQQAQQDQQDEQAAQAMQQIERTAAHLLFAGFKVARSIVARRLPEIRDEWPDAMLQDPAAAAVPLVKKHLAGIMALAGANPELAGFMVALIPMGLGLITAMDKNANTVSATVTEVQASGDGQEN